MPACGTRERGILRARIPAFECSIMIDSGAFAKSIQELPIKRAQDFASMPAALVRYDVPLFEHNLNIYTQVTNLETMRQAD